ncbi:hypothetical protein [Pontibacter fetidus]|uniref:Uncharacterized protein n=1 Tax=Pontibacter fetidus TaxID=2700082 RepID=A0A6B2GXZ1_9BACT|nr:hypothetical protein [Pontibacter fetidus]NDK55725.1 hypothetical protein [Pontibacter fetidus]
MDENRLKKLEHKLNIAAQQYWQEYITENGEQENAVVWMKNDITGEMLCLTKGDYTNQLSSFINKLR